MDKGLSCNCSKLLEVIDAYIVKANSSFSDSLVKEGYSSAAELVDKINELEDLLAEVLEVQRKLIISIVEGGYSGSCDIDELMMQVREEDFSLEEVSIGIGDIFAEFITVNTNMQLKEYEDSIITKDMKVSGLQLEALSNRTVDWVDRWSEELGSIMNLNSHKSVHKILREALEKGEGVDKVTRKLMESYSFSRTRARATAVTEMLTAHAVSSQEAISQSQAVDRKEWKHTGSRKNAPRENHVGMDGTIVGKNESYLLNGRDGTVYEVLYPRETFLPPSERVNCHCISRGIVAEDIMGTSLEERRVSQRKAVADLNDGWQKENKDTGVGSFSRRDFLLDCMNYTGKVEVGSIEDGLEVLTEYIKDDVVEHMFAIVASGNIYHTLVEDDGVNLSGIDMEGASIACNHINSYGVLSVIEDDFKLLQDSVGIAKMVIVNEPFVYIVGIKKDISKLSFESLYLEVLSDLSDEESQIDLQHCIFELLKDLGYIDYEYRGIKEYLH